MCDSESSSLRANFKNSDVKDEFKVLVQIKAIRHLRYSWGPQSIRSIDEALRN